MSEYSTIYAPLTNSGNNAVNVVRISGTVALAVLDILLNGQKAPPPRVMVVRKIYHPQRLELLDTALVVWFANPHSYTGEDVVELHLHGGRAVLSDTMDALASMGAWAKDAAARKDDLAYNNTGLSQLRIAEPGEFTRRAFLNNLLDLTEAEGIADLIAAETSAQRRQALRQMSGSISDACAKWRDELRSIVAYMEVAIDFSDEELPPALAENQRARVKLLIDELESKLSAPPSGERLRNGFYVAILGEPNVGKSSLLNALARRDAAIVSNIAGTTRDVIEARLDLGGWPVTLADTAGLRETGDIIEAEGVKRALNAARVADMIVCVFDKIDDVHELPLMIGQGSTDDIDRVPRLLVLNKGDLLEPSHTIRQRDDVIVVSALNGDGLDALEQRIINSMAAGMATADVSVITRARHREALTACLDAMRRSLDNTAHDELMAEDLRLALRALGRITGEVDIEDILDVVFRDFCLGK